MLHGRHQARDQCRVVRDAHRSRDSLASLQVLDRPVAGAVSASQRPSSLGSASDPCEIQRRAAVGLQGFSQQPWRCLMLLLPEPVRAGLVVRRQSVFVSWRITSAKDSGVTVVLVCLAFRHRVRVCGSVGLSVEKAGSGRGSLAVGVFWRFPGFSWEIVPCNTALSAAAHCRICTSLRRHLWCRGGPQVAAVIFCQWELRMRSEWSAAGDCALSSPVSLWPLLVGRLTHDALCSRLLFTSGGVQ